MKKSQVLAALALAMALGVVAPVASTFAVASSSYNDCVTANGEVYAILNEFGKDNGQNYSNLTAMLSNVNNFKEAFAPSAATLTKEINGTVAAPAAGTTGYPVYAVVNYVLTYNGQVDGRKATVADFAGKTFAQIKAMNIHFPAGVVAGNITDFNWLVASQESAIDGYAATAAADLGYFGLTDNLTSNKAEDVYAYINGLNSLTKISKLYNEFTEIQKTGACGSDNDKVVTDTTKALKEMLAAYNGNTTINNGTTEDDKKNPSAPNTGAAATAEASATASVSILSGIASVATAAGVVIRKAFRK